MTGSNGNGFGRAYARPDTTGAEELDGLHVIFDQKVGLTPANLQKKPSAPLPKRPVRTLGHFPLRGAHRDEY